VEGAAEIEYVSADTRGERKRGEEEEEV